VIELRLELSYEALEAMIGGAELQFDADDNVLVKMRCDDEALKIFREHYERALLAVLPAEATKH
jgi:hypothetical protein